MSQQNKSLPLIFLEAHNIQNRKKGLGVFNYQLLKAFSSVNTEFRMMVNMSEKALMKAFDSPLFYFHKYNSLQRQPFFRIRKRADIWHSLNQNIKIEPFHNLNYVQTIHDVIGKEKNGRERLTEKINRSNAITYISHFVKQETHRLFDIPNDVKEYVIYNGNVVATRLDISTFVPIEAAKVPFLYAIGDFLERKNFHSLVDMMRVCPDFNLIISGQNKSEYAARIQEMIETHHLGSRVFLTGVVSEEGKQYYLQHAAAFLFPSTQEGFGLPIIEAMSFGKPVFLSSLSCMPEIGGEDAYYFDNFDPEYMQQRLTSGLHHFEENKEWMTRKMKERAAFFSWEKAAKEYLQVYSDVLKG